MVGPTGIGKSEVAAEIARRVSAEIVAVDSMQVYRGMDLGTGKPDPVSRREIPHHGIDLADPEEEFDVARYVRWVRPVLEEIRLRGRLPLLVAGSGLYLRGLLDGLCQAPGKDPYLREQLLWQGREKGAPFLHEKLKPVDPKAAAKIHPNDLRRIVRALEVFQVSGRPISQWQEETTRPLDGEKHLIGLTCGRQRLYEGIDRRIDGWLAAGWLEEARRLKRRDLSRTAREALGYRELFAHLEGQIGWEPTVTLIKRNTRQYAKRQWSWFRADARVRWITTDGRSPEEVARHILAGVSAPASPVFPISPSS